MAKLIEVDRIDHLSMVSVVAGQTKDGGCFIGDGACTGGAQDGFCLFADDGCTGIEEATTTKKKVEEATQASAGVKITI